MSSLTVTYTSVYSDSEPWRFQWVSDDELEAPEEALQFLKHAPPSPNYVPGPEHPPSPDYVPGPEYPEYLEDPEGDLKEDPADRGDDDDDDDDKEDEEEDEHLAPADSTTLPAIDPVLSAEDRKTF
ncbi:hypothetical protein Tco_0322873 [Tanacetum coccineum]